MNAQATVALRDVLEPSRLDLDAAAQVLDGLTHQARLEAVQTMGKKTQALLFEAAQGRGVSIEYMVPETLGPLVPVHHHGKNSLPVFTLFQKRFCRSADTPNETLWGYNFQTMAWATGPGYYVAYVDGDQLAIDYTKTPAGKPDAWPPIASNKAKLSRFVYYGMIDYLRRVSAHVTIGRAYKGGRAQDNWFLLCREDV